MVAEGEVFEEVNYVPVVFAVVLFEVDEDADLFEGLAVEAPLVADDFDGDVGLGFVVEGFDDLAEGAFADDFEDLVAVGDVVVLEWERGLERSWCMM